MFEEIVKMSISFYDCRYPFLYDLKAGQCVVDENNNPYIIKSATRRFDSGCVGFTVDIIFRGLFDYKEGYDTDYMCETGLKDSKRAKPVCPTHTEYMLREVSPKIKLVDEFGNTRIIDTPNSTLYERLTSLHNEGLSLSVTVSRYEGLEGISSFRINDYSKDSIINNLINFRLE